MEKVYWNLIFLLGLISLLADFVYEGFRSFLGPYFSLIGGSALALGFVTGFGEFLNYVTRVLFGYLRDKIKNSWLFMLLGYSLSVLSVPFAGFFKSTFWVSLIVIFERLGKGIRTPSRDTLLSLASSRKSYGKVFGIHEFFDQVGAIIGPLWIFFAIGTLRFQPKIAFLVMAIPGFVVLLLLLFSARKYRFLDDFVIEKALWKWRDLKGLLWYFIFAVFSTLGFMSFPLFSYHLAQSKIFSYSSIPLVYGILMGIDMLMAYPLGFIYDAYRRKTLFILPLTSVLFATCLLKLNLRFISFCALFLWGFIMSFHEVVFKAHLAQITPTHLRGSAFGIFSLIYGLSQFASGFLMGMLYSPSLTQIVIFIVISGIISFLLLFKVGL